MSPNEPRHETLAGSPCEPATEGPSAGSIRRVLVVANPSKPGVRELLDRMPLWLDGRVDRVNE